MLFAWLRKKAKAEQDKARAEKSDLELRFAALKHAASAHIGRLPTDIADAADTYYTFLKGKYEKESK